jgi:CRISPR-associated endoribonuclease Cas6
MTEPLNLLSMVISLKPVESIPPGGDPPLPAWWGRAAHALLLDQVRLQNDVLAEALHDPDSGARPFTVSTLIGPSTRKGLEAETTYRLRMTSLRADLVEILLKAAQPGSPLSPGSLVELDYLGFQIQSVQPHPDNAQSQSGSLQSSALNDQSSWSCLTSYQELSAPYLLARENAPHRVTLKFTSPTSFKSKGMHVPIPTPELVFGSLLDRWNTFAPIAFPAEVKRYASECLAVSRFKLHSLSVPVKSRGIRVGGLGQVTYTSLNYDRYWMSLIQTLAKFAIFSGVGAGTTNGMGQCKVEGWN